MLYTVFNASGGWLVAEQMKYNIEIQCNPNGMELEELNGQPLLPCPSCLGMIVTRPGQCERCQVQVH